MRRIGPTVLNGGKAEFVRIDLEEAEDRYELEPIDKLTPEKIFDAGWAIALLGEAMNRLGREYMAQGKESTFRALRAFLDPMNAKRPPTYEEVAAQLGLSIGSLKTQIHRLRKQYTAPSGRRLVARFQTPLMWTRKLTNFAKL